MDTEKDTAVIPPDLSHCQSKKSDTLQGYKTKPEMESNDWPCVRVRACVWWV